MISSLQIFDFELKLDEMAKIKDFDKGAGGRLFKFGFVQG